MMAALIRLISGSILAMAREGTWVAMLCHVLHSMDIQVVFMVGSIVSCNACLLAGELRQRPVEDRAWNHVGVMACVMA